MTKPNGFRDVLLKEIPTDNDPVVLLQNFINPFINLFQLMHSQSSGKQENGIAKTHHFM